MKKLLVGTLLVLSLSVLSGCGETQVAKSQSDFELKEKCSKYILDASKPVDKYNNLDVRAIDHRFETLKGVFYSKNLQSCISIRESYGSNETGGNHQEYDDLLTGSSLTPSPTFYTDKGTVDYQKYEESLYLIN